MSGCTRDAHGTAAAQAVGDCGGLGATAGAGAGDATADAAGDNGDDGGDGVTRSTGPAGRRMESSTGWTIIVGFSHERTASVTPACTRPEASGRSVRVKLLRNRVVTCSTKGNGRADEVPPTAAAPRLGPGVKDRTVSQTVGFAPVGVDMWANGERKMMCGACVRK